MSVETFSLNDTVTVTPAAAEHFQAQLKKKGAQAIRISLKESGCTGFMYVIDEVDSGETSDLEITLKNGVQVFVDPTHMAAIQGTVVDYVKQGLNRNLELNNPNVKNACGCGESFSV
ncbi:HesB/IscA family protein [Teredinibacter purpureus]|jgi:Iron-sulfur cluster assembly accessory protein|uniref:HesB/IscA family protein n=1 Tax=Teredinibacter purpureus TaxID=2731756 RepID=UPI0005F85844|nr:iron-sulfur cluster assembly accessory protein [Teredinibacter purpureus]